MVLWAALPCPRRALPAARVMNSARAPMLLVLAPSQARLRLVALRAPPLRPPPLPLPARPPLAPPAAR
eukprot:1269609-Alexandrium_andersonii.AAC.1